MRLNNRVKEDPGSIVIRCQPHCDHTIPPVLTQTSSFPALPRGMRSRADRPKLEGSNEAIHKSTLRIGRTEGSTAVGKTYGD